MRCRACWDPLLGLMRAGPTLQRWRARRRWRPACWPRWGSWRPSRAPRCAPTWQVRRPKKHWRANILEGLAVHSSDRRIHLRGTKLLRPAGPCVAVAARTGMLHSAVLLLSCRAAAAHHRRGAGPVGIGAARDRRRHPQPGTRAASWPMAHQLSPFCCSQMAPIVRTDTLS